MTPGSWNPYIVRTLLYYDIFEHPLTADELFHLLPRNSITKRSFLELLGTLTGSGSIHGERGYYSIPHEGADLAGLRIRRERLARRRFPIASLMAHVIKRFPFVRGIFISGDLSKGVANPKSDIDYVVVTVPGRLWICRMLLVAFKKVFLLNSKKYFCLNYYLDSDHLVLDDRNYYTATEIAHLKPLFNSALYLKYMNANSWIKGFFPNYRISALRSAPPNNRRSVLQSLLELPFKGKWADRLDARLMEFMKRVWRKRYPGVDEATRDHVFRCSISESRAYVGNFSGKVLSIYRRKLEAYSLPAELTKGESPA
ncbi:MAG TPA: hypothetical protein VI215_06680 [Bacteroidota bacterium]|jgi:hypothetical protein